MPGSQPKREINIRRQYLKLITEGIKTVEVRVGYRSMRAIEPGHVLTFVSGDHRVPTTVRRVTEYRSVEELAVIRSIYPPEKERLGVLAIEIELARCRTAT